MFFVFGSYRATWRTDISMGNRLADGCVDRALQYAGAFGVRILAVNQSRPCESNMGLCTSLRLVQIALSPQYGEDFNTGPAAWGNFGSGGGNSTVDVVPWTGSSTGRRSLLSSGAP